MNEISQYIRSFLYYRLRVSKDVFYVSICQIARIFSEGVAKFSIYAIML